MQINNDIVQSEKNLSVLENLMGIDISDDELLNMDPELLLKIQSYLKEYREKKKNEENLAPSVEESVTVPEHISDDLTVLRTWKIEEADALFEEVETKQGKFLGTRITQDGRTYIARKWKMTEQVKEILLKSVETGFPKFWRYGQPQDSYFTGGSNYLKGSHHISCSSRHDDPWVFALGAESLGKEKGEQKVKEVTFNKIYELYWDSALTGEVQDPTEGPLEEGKYKIQKFGGRCFSMHPKDFGKVIEYFAENKVEP